MRSRCGRIFAAVAASATLPLAALADATPEVVSSDLAFALDTCTSPRLIKTAAELGEITGGTFKAAWRKGETVAMTAPDGAVTQIADGSAAGTAVLQLDAGGGWTLANSRAGESRITVRYSCLGSPGSGTSADPLKVVDDDEIAEIPSGSLSSGFYIALRGWPGLDLSSLALGSGLSLTGLGDGVWRVDAAAGGLVASSPASAWRVDSLPSPRAIKTAADEAGLWPVTRRAGETVTLRSPSGSASTLIAADSDATSAALSLNAGGLWTASNSKQGTATFTVRHSLKGTLGGGTEASPAKLVDGDELVDYSAGDGYVFTLNGDDSLLGALELPAGFRLEAVDGAGAAQMWRIVSDASGKEYAWSDLVARLDTYLSGPDRRIHMQDTMPVSYSGDNWTRKLESASTLTLTAPSGAVTEYDLSGTDSITVCFNETGAWLITLVSDGGTLTSTVNVSNVGLYIILK